MAINKTLHPRDDGDWVYVQRKEERVLATTEDSFDASIQWLKDYIKMENTSWLTIWDKVKKILTMPSQSDAPEESDLWTAWQLFLLDDDHTCHSKDSGSDTSQWPVIERNRAGELGWQYWTRWRSHRAATKWCTGREWPVNCMTVISARWRSHMPFQSWRKWHISIARYQKKLRGRGGVSLSPRGSLKVI